jgi:uncharacterized DUF497 family protein
MNSRAADTRRLPNAAERGRTRPYAAVRGGYDIFGVCFWEDEGLNDHEEEDRVTDGELRLRMTGMAEGQLIVLVVPTNRDMDKGTDEIARIIHARKASPGERSQYERVRASVG